jgi:hypothetical protein
MIHRGVQYSRAIRAYYKKFQRYPTKLEDLDHTNNLRYLRKHYKDPLNKNQDFRLLHYGEQGVTLSGGIAAAMIPGASPAGAAAALAGPGAMTGGVGGSGLGGSGLGGSGLGGSGVNTSGVFAQSPGLGGSANSGLGTSSNSQATPGQQAANPASGSDPTQAAAGSAQGDTSSGGQQLLASGPIVGVASICKKDTIRVFNKKKTYNEWQFIYDPAVDRGGLITTPYQPSLPSFAAQPGQNGIQTGAGGNSFGQSPFGQSSSGQSSFGQSGFGNNSGSGVSTPPVQPPTTSPPQQQ